MSVADREITVVLTRSDIVTLLGGLMDTELLARRDVPKTVKEKLLDALIADGQEILKMDIAGVPCR